MRYGDFYIASVYSLCVLTVFVMNYLYALVAA